MSGKLKTAAVRAPAHDIARALVDAAGVPIAAPSANRSGRLSPTTAEAVMEDLGGRIDAILDGGPCPFGIESSIVGFSSGRPTLLRSGAIAREAIEKITGPLFAPEGGRLEAPGMMASHYAPRAQLRLNAQELFPGEALLGFGAHRLRAEAMCNLSPAGDLQEAAANLYGMLRQLDRTGAKTIAVTPIPAIGLGEAINDRLARAAAPRP